MSDRVSDITVTSISRMPLRDDEPPSNRVWLKTKGVNYKEYLIYLTEEAIVFSRPKSAKQQLLQYALTSFQCLADVRPHVVKTQSSKKAVPTECLLLISSPTQQRSIFFETKALADMWCQEILRL